MTRKASVLLLFLISGLIPAFGSTLHVPEDYPTIQAAIDAVETGGRIYVSSGTYVECLAIQKAVTLVGEGPETTVIEATDPVSSAVTILAVGLVQIENVAITGAIGVSTAGVLVRGNSSVCLSRCQIEGNRYGVVCAGDSRVELETSDITENGLDGIAAVDRSSIFLSGCSIRQNGGNGLTGMHSSQTRSDSCSLEENSAAGVWAANSCEMRLADCSLTRNEYGVVLQEEAVGVLRRVQVVKNSKSGITCMGNSQAQVLDCAFFANESGLRLSDEAMAEISDSSFEGNRSYGVAVTQGTSTTGAGNYMAENGCDLAGKLPAGFRIPLRPATETRVVYPSVEYDTLQEAIDALLPGGDLLLRVGEHKAGITIEKPVVIRGEGRAQTSLVAQAPGSSVISLISSGSILAETLTVRGGDEGIAAAGSAVVELDGVAIEENAYGVMAQDNAEVTARNAAISRNRHDGLFLRGSARVGLHDCEIVGNGGHGVRTEGEAYAEGAENLMQGNGCDLAGNVNPALRLPLRDPLVAEVAYPSAGYTTLQEAIDALLPGGILTISGESHVGGVTVSKPLTMAAAPLCRGVIFEAPSEHVTVLSLVSGADLTLEGFHLKRGFAGLCVGGNAKARAQWCTFSENERFGVFVGRAGAAELLDCTVQLNGIGICLYQTVGLSLKRCNVSANRTGLSALAPLSDSGAVTSEVPHVEVTGFLNCISGNSEADLVPDYPGRPWPADTDPARAPFVTGCDPHVPQEPIDYDYMRLMLPASELEIDEIQIPPIATVAEKYPILVSLFEPELPPGYTSYHYTLNPHQICVTDLDGDDTREIIVSDEDLPLVYVVRGAQVEVCLIGGMLRMDPDGSPSTFQSGITSMAAGDITGDGVEEIVLIIGGMILAATYAEGEFDVVWQQSAPGGKYADAVTVADINGDGLNDIVLTRGVFYQQRDAAFGELVRFDPEWPYHGDDLEVADLNGDGLVDIVRARSGWGVLPGASGFEAMYQTESHRLVSSETYVVPAGQSLKSGTVSIGDVSGDGRADVVTAGAGHLIVYYQRDDGSMNPRVYPVYGGLTGPEVFDVDGNGRLDIVACNGWGDLVVWRQGETGALRAPAYYRALQGHKMRGTPCVADVDGDGRPGIICGLENSLVAVVDLYEPTLTEGLPTHRREHGASQTHLPLIDTAVGLSVERFLIDPVVPAYAGDERTLLLTMSPGAVAVGDVNADGQDEIVVADSAGPRIYVWDNAAVRAYSTPDFPRGVAPGFGSDWWLAIADLNEDGRDDVAVSRDGRDIVVLLQTEEGVLEYAQSVATGTGVQGGLAIGDMNQDGLPDLVTAGGIHYQQKGHLFGELDAFPEQGGPNSGAKVDVEVADMNGDSLLDVVRAVSYALPHRGSPLTYWSGFELLFQDEGHEFDEPIPFGREWDSAPKQWIAVGDMTGDDRPDVVFCVSEDAQHGGETWIYPQCDEGLGDPVESQMGGGSAPIIADFNGDGRNDLAVFDSYDKISVALQTETGGSGSVRSFPASIPQHPGTDDLAAGDVTGDGHADIVCVANYDDGLCILPSVVLLAESFGTVEEAIGYWEAILRNTVDPVSEALVLNELAVLNGNLGRFEDALEYAQRAVLSSETHRLLFWTALALSTEGALRYTLGDFEGASASCWMSSLLYEQFGYGVGERRSYRNVTLTRLGLGDWENAVDLWEYGTRSLLRAFGAEWAYEPDLIAFGLFHRGLLGDSDNEFGRLLEGVAVDFGNIGAVEAIYGDVQKGIEFLERSAELSRNLRCTANEAMALGNTGNACARLGRTALALSYYRHAIRLMESITLDEGSISVPEALWILRYNLGVTCEQRDDSEAARDQYEHAIGIIESLLESLSLEELKVEYQEKTRIVYERLVDLLYRMNEGTSALLYVERCRARTFLDLVAAGPVGTLDSIAEEGIRTGVVDASVIKSNLAEVVADLPANTAALEYFVTGGATYLWLVRDGLASDPIRIGSSRAELRKQVLAFRTTIETTSTKMSETPDPEEGMETVSRDLYELLIAPVEDQLEGIEHLVIVPSGPLYYLPFCALIDCPSCEGPAFCSGEYLVERYTLSYIPSLTTLKYAWAAADEVRDDPLFLALADPDSGDARFPRLVSMQHEAIAVAGLFDPSELHVATAATEEVVMARASEADQILLSTHGSFNPYNPMFSYLLLSPTDDSDGRLYTHEIFSLDLHTSLVTLSACETLLPALKDAEDQVRAIRGTAEEDPADLSEQLLEALTAGDEIVGLTRAFLAAGTPSVLSSLWSIVSITTEPLMVAFYGYLDAGLDKAEALRQAQLDVMATYPHPRYWAAFSLVGDWR